MERFNRLSLVAKILIVAVSSLTVLTIILFILYSFNSRRKTIEAYVEKARSITLTAESTRQEMEKKWEQDIFSLDMIRVFARQDDMEKVLSMVPVVSAWNAAMRKAEKGGYTFRVPKFSPRKPENEPDYGLDYAIEGPALKKMKAENLEEYYVIDEKINAVRYFLPVKLTENCMICHGDPATSTSLWGNDQGLDPTGNRMENWGVGEIHGAFQVIQSLDRADMELKSDVLKAGGVAMAGILSALCIFYFVISRNVVRPIQSIITGIEDGSGQVAEASGHVSESSQDLADGSTTQAAAVEEISSSLEQISSMTRLNTDNALNADRLMRDANEIIKKANSAMENLILSMERITRDSEETSKIIKTIDEISFQTNLLSLNAAVEAARAGEAGAGFAVVADEVRALALRAAEAAGTTAGLIENSVASTEKGKQIVKETGDAFSKVLESSKKISTFVSEIATSSKEQSTGIEQVNQSISEVNRITQQNAATAEESAASSEELNAQAETMSTYVKNLNRIVSGGGGDLHQFDRIMKRDADRKGKTKPALYTGSEVNSRQVIDLDDDSF